MIATSTRRDWAARGVCLAALVWCGLVLLSHWAAGTLACGLDTSYCAKSRDKNGVYRGVLLDRQGRTLTNTSFSVAFESRIRSAPREVSGFSTDAQGNYCIVWAQEDITLFVTFDGSETSIRDQWQPLNGRASPPGCQAGDDGIPWNRADDLMSSPQFLAVPAVGLPGVVLLLVGLVLGGRPTARRPRTAGLVLTLATTLLAPLIWFVLAE